MKKLSFIFISIIFSISCSSVSKSTKKSAGEFQLRPVQEKTLPNGLKVLYITDNSLPRVSYNLLVKSGSAQDPKGSEGLTALTVSLLEQGSRKRPALRIADDFAQLGSSFSDMASNDYVLLATTGLSQFRSELLELFADVIFNPVFAKNEIERKRSQVVAELTQLVDRPSDYAGLLFDKELFGSHPYAHPISGNIPAVKKITREQIVEYYQRTFLPENSILAIAGNFDEAFKAKIEETFSKWNGKAPQMADVPVPQAHAKRDYKLYTKSGLQQTQIRIGQLAIPRNDPDFLKLRLANVVLGGAFASRLNQKVRDDLGLTYSISSGFDARLKTGSFEISTFARNEKVADAIKATLQVIEEFRQKGITEDELKASKALLVGQFPAAIETVDRLAFNLLALRVYGVPDTYLTDFFSNVNSITLKEVNQAIEKHVKPEQMKVVVFADETAVQKQLKEMAPFSVEKVQ